MNLSLRDKQLILFLLGFLLLAGIYQFGLEPLYLKLQQSQRDITEKSAELAKIEVKVHRQQALNELHDELLHEAGLLKASLNLDLLDVPMPQRIKTITALAQAGSTRISNLRPLSIIEPETGEKREGLIIEGETTNVDFERFLAGLTGLHINELAMSRSDRKERPLKFYLNGNIIPAEELALLAEIKLVAPPQPEQFEESFVEIAETEPLDEPDPVEMTEPQPAFDLNYLSLLGLSLGGTGGLAIIADQREGKDYFLRVGEMLAEYRITAIDKRGVELQNSIGESGRLEFPEDTQSLIPMEEADKQEPITEITLEDALPKKKGRLGIRFKELTATLAKSKKISVAKGLLVLKSREDVTEILPGDVLSSINGTVVGSFYGAKKALQNVVPGDAVELGVVTQDGQAKTVSVSALE